MIRTVSERGDTNMANNTVITIGRQYGSGGHDIGIKLAQEMGIQIGRAHV